MTSDNNDSEDWGLSRRNYVKGLGVAGLASAVGFSGTARGAVPDENIVSVGAGGYTTEIPDTSNLSFPDGGGYGEPPGAEYTYTTDDATGPVPTNGWWNSVAFGPSRWYDEDGNPYGQGALVSLPDYAITSERGITIQNPTDWGGDTSRSDFVKMDYINSPKLTVSNSGTSSYADTRADDWGDWHTRARWGDGTSTVMDATVVKGTPFRFLEFEGGGAEITFEIKDSRPGSVMLADASNIDVWADRGNVLGVTIDGITADNYSHHFAIFAPSGATFDGVGSNTLTSDLAGQGYMTVAALPDAQTSTLDLFEQYAYNFVRDTYADYDYVQTENGQPVSEVRTTFDYTVEQKPESTASGTLSGLLPHQWKHSDDPVTGHEYWTPRGTMKLHEGGSFQTTLKFPGILPFMPDEGSYDRAQLETFVDDQTNDDLWQEGVGTETNTYFAGKDFDHHLRTVPLAQQVDHTAARDRSLDALRTRIGGWQFWTTDTVEGIDLPAGEHVLRLYIESGSANVNWLEFVSAGGSGTTLSGSAGSGWSATVTEVATDSYEFAFEPANTAGWPISSSTTAPAGSATAWTTATATTSTPTLATPAASPASTSASSTTTVPPAST